MLHGKLDETAMDDGAVSRLLKRYAKRAGFKSTEPPRTERSRLSPGIKGCIYFRPAIARVIDNAHSKWSRELLTFILLFVAATSSANAFSDELAPFVYDARADLKASSEELAKLISEDYRQAPDEFLRHELMERLKPVIDQRRRDAQSLVSMELRFRSELAEYDFSSEAFPTGLSSATYLPHGGSYATTFSNADLFASLPMPLEQAKVLAPLLRKDRTVILTVLAKPVGSSERRLNWSTNKTIQAEISTVEIRLTNGKVLAKLTAPQKRGKAS